LHVYIIDNVLQEFFFSITQKVCASCKSSCVERALLSKTEMKGFRLRNMMFPPCKQSQHINSRNRKSITFWHVRRKYRHAESCVVVNMVQFCRLHFSYPEMCTPRVGGLMHLDAHIVVVPLILSWVGLLISITASMPPFFSLQISVAAN
jgi:hypothetical protein